MPSVLVSFEAKTHEVVLSQNVEESKAMLSALFSCESQDIVGFAQGRHLFPVSFLCNSSPRADKFPIPFDLLVHRVRLVPILKTVLFSFANNVQFTSKEAELFHALQEKSQLTYSQLEASIAKNMNDQGILFQHTSFTDLMRDMFPSFEQGNGFSARLFACFDRDHSGRVLAREMFVALALLVHPDQRGGQGLEFAFSLADGNNDGVVDRKEFFNFTLSFVSLLISLLSSSSLTVDLAYIQRMVDRCFSQADANQDGVLSYEELAAWYRKRSHDMPWLSLLMSKSHHHHKKRKIVFDFNLLGSAESLRMEDNHVAELETLLMETKLYERDLFECIQLLCSRAENGFVSRECYDVCLRRLIPSKKTKTLSETSSDLLALLFSAFAQTFPEGEYLVRVDELCTGFALLVQGSKSSKLQICFSLFEPQVESGLTPTEFARFLSSVLKGLSVFSTLNGHSENAIEACCKRVANMVPLDEELGTITFFQFAQFYNTQHGNELISFVELLDLKKFPFERINLVATSKPLENKMIFSFDLSSGKRLQFMQSDCDRLQTLVEETGLIDMSTEDLFTIVGSEHASMWSKQEFDEIVLILTNHEKNHQDFFQRVFDALEVEGQVREKQILCVLSVLCGVGKKSDKLSLTFNLFSHSLEQRTLFLSSFLLTLFLLSSSPLDWDVKRFVHEYCSDMAKSCGTSFDDFAKWYGEGGYKPASFLELLDLHKWPFSSKTVLSPKKQKNVEPKAHVVFVFHLTKKHSLIFSKEDIAFVKNLVMTSHLASFQAEDMVHAVSAAQCLSPTVSRQEFIHEFLQGQLSLPTCALDTLAILHEVCNDRDDMDAVPWLDLLGGLVMLCGGGSKSTKLVAMWPLYSREKAFELTRQELFRVFKSLLIPLFAFNYEANKRSLSDTLLAVDEGASSLVGSVFLLAKRKKREVITFEEFAGFYSTEGGYALAPWLELLNLVKFVGGIEEEEEEEKSSPTSDVVVFSFPLADHSAVLTIKQKHVEHMHTLVSMGGNLQTMEPEEMIKALMKHGGEDGQLQLEDFGTFVGAYVLTGGEKDEAMAESLARLFASFDPNGSGSVYAPSFAVGLLLLAKGSKSSKLGLAWTLFGTDKLGFSGLTDFLLSLLTSISSFSGQSVTPVELAQTAQESALRVFGDLKLKETDELSFGDFADWYTTRGFECLSWIELLATSKWKLPEEKAKLPASHL